MEAHAIESFGNYLKGIAPFLTDEDCSFFLPYLRLTRVAPKAHWLKRGQVCHNLGFVLSGAFRVYYEDEDREANTHFIFANDFAAEYGSFLNQTASRYSIQALAPCMLIEFGFEALQEAYAKSHGWERLGRLIAEAAYTRSRKRAESFLFLDGEGRYLQAIREEPDLFRQVPLYHIASYLGLERESLSRIRRRLSGKRGM
jgi:CRP-like cAMP-binding protein